MAPSTSRPPPGGSLVRLSGMMRSTIPQRVEKTIRRGDPWSPADFVKQNPFAARRKYGYFPSGNPKNFVFRRAITDRPYKLPCKRSSLTVEAPYLPGRRGRRPLHTMTANEKRPPFGGRGIHFLSFWQYWVHSLSVHSEHLRAALDLSQNRSGYIMMHTSHTSHARNARLSRLTA